MAVTLKSRLPEIERVIQLRVSRKLKEGADRVGERAQQNLNTITGQTEQSVDVTGGMGAYRVQVKARDEKGRPYPKWIEFGHGDTPPHPFLYPALEAEAEQIKEDVESVLERL